MNMDYNAGPFEPKNSLINNRVARSKEVKRAACIQEPERPQGGSEASNVGPGGPESVPARFLFLRESRTEGLWPKCRGLLERRRARGARHARPRGRVPGQRKTRGDVTQGSRP